jgi:CheY-like chemotaxis protein
MSRQQVKVLLIDDERSFCGLLKLNLEDSGRYMVCVETASEHAVATVRAFRPDVILLDIIMPGCGGKDIAHALSQDTVLSRIPIIYLTAALSRSDMERCDHTVDGRRCLVKPVQIVDVVQAITQAVEPTDTPPATRTYARAS